MASYTFLNYRKHYKISNKIYLAVALGEKLGTFIYIYLSKWSPQAPANSLTPLL